MCKNWEKQAKAVLKPTQLLLFKIQSCKRLILTQTSHKENDNWEPHYKNDSFHIYGKYLQERKRTLQINLQVIIPLSSVIVKSKKLADVNDLLTKHFGAD